MGWIAAAFFVVIAIAAPYFALLGGMMAVMGITAFGLHLNRWEQVYALFLFDAVGFLWIGIKAVVAYHERQQKRELERQLRRIRHYHRRASVPSVPPVPSEAPIESCTVDTQEAQPVSFSRRLFPHLLRLH